MAPPVYVPACVRCEPIAVVAHVHLTHLFKCVSISCVVFGDLIYFALTCSLPRNAGVHSLRFDGLNTTNIGVSMLLVPVAVNFGPACRVVSFYVGILILTSFA